MRSAGYEKPVELYDNAIVQFPIWYYGPVTAVEDNYFALSQSLVSCIATGELIQMYPFADHVLRTAVPEAVWPLMRPLSKKLRRRVVIARLYLHSDQSHHYRMQNLGGEVSLDKSREPLRKSAKPTISALSKILTASKFKVLGSATFGTSTSSHFASSLTRTDVVSLDTGELSPDVYVCDATLFPESPALSPTFTVMANACRIAEAAL